MRAMRSMRLAPEAVLVALAMGALHLAGWTGSVPTPVMVFLIVLALVTRTARSSWQAGTRPDRERLATTVQVVGFTAATYAMGWGPVLVPGLLLFVVGDVFRFGPGRLKKLLVVGAGSVAVGQTVVELGWAHTYVPLPYAHGAAVLGTLTVINLSTTIARAAGLKAAAEAKVSHSESRFRALAEFSPMGIAHLDDDGAVIYGNDRFFEMMGEPERPPVPWTGWRTHFAPVYLEQITDAFLAGLLGEGIEVPYQRDDETRWARIRLAEMGDLPGHVASMVDVTEQVRVREELRTEARHDGLTGLRNRGSFVQIVDEVVSQLPVGVLSAVAFIDLDRFKLVNDSHGHAVGDELLIEAGRRIAAVLRASDVVARLGGDEFAVLLGETDLDRAVGVVERLLDELRRPFALGEAVVGVGASIGLVVLDGAQLGAENALRAADLAMYRAKGRSGGYEVVDARVGSFHIHS